MSLDRKFSLDLEDFDQNLAQAIENDRPRMSVVSQTPIANSTVKPATFKKKSFQFQISTSPAILEVPETKALDHSSEALESGSRLLVLLWTLCSTMVALAVWHECRAIIFVVPLSFAVSALLVAVWGTLGVLCLEPWISRQIPGKFQRLSPSISFACVALPVVLFLAFNSMMPLSRAFVIWIVSCISWIAFDQLQAHALRGIRRRGPSIHLWSMTKTGSTSNSLLLYALLMIAVGGLITWFTHEQTLWATAWLLTGTQWLFWTALRVILSTQEIQADQGIQADGGGF